MNRYETVCAVIVTYNRKNLLIECLEAVTKQTRPVQAIYIIDNHSTDGTPELLFEKGYIDELPSPTLTEPWEKEFLISNQTDFQPIKIHYVRMHENTGGAGGFYEGIKRAYERGYDWLWLMDDDGVPDLDCLRVLFIYKDKGDFISPLVISKEDNKVLAFYLGKGIKTVEDAKSLSTDGIIPNRSNPFNGVLIRSKVVNVVGFPKKELFIWGDETEYYYRVLKNTFRVVTIVDAKFYHPKMTMQKKIANRFHVIYDESTKYKYYIRNTAYLYSRFGFYKLLIKHILKYMWFFVITRHFDIRGLLNFFKLTIYGIIGKLGKI